MLGKISYREHVQNPARSSLLSRHNSDTHSTKSALLSAVGPVALVPVLRSSLDHYNPRRDISAIPPHIFAENKQPPATSFDLPELDERLKDTPQLAYCLGLLKAWQSASGDVLDPDACKWLRAIEKDKDEEERLNKLATDLIKAFAQDELKDAKTVAEVVHLAPVLKKDNFRDLLKQFYDGIKHSGLLDFYQLEGLAQLMQGTGPGYLEAADLVIILGHLSERLQGTHNQSPNQLYHLTLTVSNVLDGMADIGPRATPRAIVGLFGWSEGKH